jgi:RNA polymerase sigma factor (TIGR02999 family)
MDTWDSRLPTIDSCIALRESPPKPVMPRQSIPTNDSGDGEAPRGLDDVFNLAYEELRRLASSVRRNEVNATLNSTALVHEAWLRLAKSPPVACTSKLHFKRIAARAMRRILIEAARRRNAQKRGGVQQRVTVSFGAAVVQIVSCDEELLALDTALEELARVNPRQASIVESRFFAGLSVEETAGLFDVAKSTAERDWRAARAWLAKEIRGSRQSGAGS